MRKRNLKKTILAAALAVPVAFSYPGWAVRAQEDEKVSTETEAQEVMQDNTAPKEAECEENPAHDEMDGAETDSTETDSTEADRNASEEEKFFQSGLIANEDGEFLSSLAEMETPEEDSMFFQDGLEVLEDGNTDDLIDAYVAPENYAQEGTPVREGKGGFTAVANGSTLFSSKYTRLGWNADTQVYSWNNAGNDVISGMKQGAMVEGPYFVPLNNNAKGKFGFRVTHVGYNKEANTKVDLLLTCNNYQDYTYRCTGEITAGKNEIHCFGNDVHGTVDLADSLAYSCNTSFSNIGLSLDIDEFRNTAEDLLFDSELPCPLVYNESKFNLQDDDGDAAIAMTAFGQGKLQVSPYHMALITSAIANNGILMQPYLVDQITSAEGETVEKYVPESYKELMTSEEAAQLTEYMQGVVEYGTARSLNSLGVSIAGKTGTSEYSDDKEKTHSWFIGFSNVDNPDLALAVVIENSDSTGDVATDVAGDVFEAFYAE